tara:strand:- start:1127 stop:1831 length:705 start_codon:yes stop_codon:yes gene_type:complete
MYDEKNYHSIFYDSNKHPCFNSKIIDKINILKTNSKLNICDFGCGNANFLNSLSLDFKKVGVEYSLDYVNYLQNNYKDITFLDIENFLKNKEYENYFDIIYLGDVLEHLTTPHKIMSHLVSYLSHNGLFIIEGPIEENYNLIYYVSKLIGYIKFLTGIKNSFVPYHIYRTNHNSQKLFFNNINYLHINSYETYETGWPYKNNGALRNFISNINFILFNNNKSRANRFICTLSKN